MGCPSDVYLEDNLVFSICTHDPDTGILTDADALPSYRVYEDETAIAILTGTMAKLDDANTTGFYTESIACTAANGFESGKTYTIYIEATVDSDTGGISFGFKAKSIASIWDLSNGIETGLTPRQAMRLITAAVAGKLSGAATVTVTIRNAVADDSNRITATVDADGNRSAIVYDLT